MNCRLSFLIFLIASRGAFASNDVINTRIKNTISQNTTVNVSHVGTAKDWALTDKEWSQYINLMQGLSGHYYKNLSPPEVLGIHAESMDERRHFAEIAATLEHDKLERELRFNAAFHEAAKRLYSTEPMIESFDYTPFTPIPKN
ncbi:MAG: family integrating conjugative element protein [Gammaproteobacteria bacterium]|jgi:integrating conjugative element protein (TIGR03759 family)|nr:family integrating conjugative element protein [Gammaproteobacteria bacterium]